VRAHSDDAEVGNLRCTNSWPACVQAQSGNYLVGGYPWGTLGVDLFSDGYSVRRVFLNFDTRVIPKTAVITSATLYVYAGEYMSGDTMMHVLASSAGRPPTNSDFGRVTAARLGMAGASRNAWVAIQLNAAGLQNITREGATSFALTQALDLGGSAPTGPNNVLIAMAENTSYTPFLVVNYHTP
jgi:hypothetical protein